MHNCVQPKKLKIPSLSVLVRRSIEQVGEHPGTATTFVFELDAYPEAKILDSTKIKAIQRRIKSWSRVAELIEASEACSQQNSKMLRADSVFHFGLVADAKLAAKVNQIKNVTPSFGSTGLFQES